VWGNSCWPWAQCGLRVVRIDLFRFLAMSYNATKPGLVCVLYLNTLRCLLGPFLCIVNFRWYAFCLLVILVKLSLLAKRLAINTPPRKPNRGDGIISIKSRPKRAYHCVGLLYSFVVLLHDICVLPRPYVLHFLLVWQWPICAESAVKNHLTITNC